MNKVTLVCALFLACAVVASADVYQIIDAATGRCLDNGPSRNARPVELWNCVADEERATRVGQRWTVETAPGAYSVFSYIKDQATGRCLDNGPNPKGDSKPPELWNCVEDEERAALNGQLWKILCSRTTGLCRIMEQQNIECLGNGSGANSEPLSMTDCHFNDDDAARDAGALWQVNLLASSG